MTRHLTALPLLVLLATTSSARAATPATTAPPAAKTTPPAQAAPAPAPAPAIEDLPLELPPEPPAPPPDAPPPAPSRPVAFVALTGGVLIPNLFGALNVAATPELWGGWFAPVLDGKLAATLSVGYAQPSHTRSAPDPRVAGGAIDYTLTVQDLRIAPGLQFHFLPPAEALSPYAGARLRIHLLKTTESATAGGQPIGDAVETATQVGGALFGGAMYRLGPGMLVGELEVDLAPLQQAVTGSANLSALLLRVGYGLTF